MSYTTIAITDLQDVLNKPELTALQTLQLSSGQDDPATTAISNAVALVRGYVTGNNGNQLEAGETVPSELKSATVAIAVYTLSKRLPLAEKRADQLKTSYDEAIAMLKDVASGKFAIQQPDIPATITHTRTGGSAVVASRTRVTSSLNRLL
jgi:phage gp36-like protein